MDNEFDIKGDIDEYGNIRSSIHQNHHQNLPGSSGNVISYKIGTGNGSSHLNNHGAYTLNSEKFRNEHNFSDKNDTIENLKNQIESAKDHTHIKTQINQIESAKDHTHIKTQINQIESANDHTHIKTQIQVQATSHQQRHNSAQPYYRNHQVQEIKPSNPIQDLGNEYVPKTPENPVRKRQARSPYCKKRGASKSPNPQSSPIQNRHTTPIQNSKANPIQIPNQ